MMIKIHIRRKKTTSQNLLFSTLNVINRSRLSKLRAIDDKNFAIFFPTLSVQSYFCCCILSGRKLVVSLEILVVAVYPWRHVYSFKISAVIVSHLCSVNFRIHLLTQFCCITISLVKNCPYNLGDDVRREFRKVQFALVVNHFLWD